MWLDRISPRSLVASSRPLPRSFYARPAVDVARDLLGTILVHRSTAGRIVETEAYLGATDLAAHASRGVTPRTQLLFGLAGYSYVYLIYGLYTCLNVVAELPGTPGCVLIRALEPLYGLRQMKQRRRAAQTPAALTAGPGKLTQALDITLAKQWRGLNGPQRVHDP